MGRRDGRGHVCDAASGRAGHGDGVDAVDGGSDVDGGVVDIGFLSEGECDKREEEDKDLLEGAHLDVVVVVMLWGRSVCCYATVANAQRVTIESSDGRDGSIEMLRQGKDCLRRASSFV